MSSTVWFVATDRFVPKPWARKLISGVFNKAGHGGVFAIMILMVLIRPFAFKRVWRAKTGMGGG